MASFQRKIAVRVKRQLIDEGGGKCANPGCPNWRAHIHHIRHWAIYRAHQPADMIAICPSCHDAVHHGQFAISDETLFTWKGIVRPQLTSNNAHIYVEPAATLKLLVGSICLASVHNQASVFELTNSNELRFRVLDGHDILLVTARLENEQGQTLLRVVDNYVRAARNEGITFDSRPGRVRITVPVVDRFAPQWLLDQVRFQVPGFAADGQIVVLDMEVLKPGLIRVQGCWPNGNVGVVITESALSFCTRGLREPISLVGTGEDTIFQFEGPINAAMFAFSDSRGANSSGAIIVPRSHFD